MAVKILAADDSATMRKVLEMTFAGEGVDLTTVDSGQAAVDAASSSPPDLVIADGSMDMSGYDVAAALKGNPATSNVAVILLASQHHPYDAARGKASGVDDHLLKPYDSQALIDKAKEVLGKPRATASVAPAARAPSAAPSAPAPVAAAPSRKPPARPRSTVAFGAMPARPEVQPPGRPVLELAEEKPAAPQPPARKPPAVPLRPKLKPPGASPAPTPTPRPSAAVATATAAGGDMAGKLQGMGLSAAQVEGVLALSREVIERVVWEVVPDLAEVIIKEEIKRLTSE